MAEKITIEATVEASVGKVWDMYTEPQHITQWNHASDDWHSPHAVNDLRVGGTFNFRMEAKDGSEGFDFEGVYTDVVPKEKIAYEMGDGRKVDVMFKDLGEMTQVTVTFDAETQNSLEVQRSGWQAILDNFKKYVDEG
jgi:uncharacterized protein YndB with AHSA1/START domain